MSVSANSSILARIDTPSGYIADGRMHYYVKDYQGNVRQVTDADGKVEQDNHYYPYGMLMAESSDILTGNTSATANPYLYGGKEYLTTGSANLLDFTARTYDPTTLLFHTVDPKATDYTPLNSYLYSGGDPINFFDPDGFDIYEINSKGEITNIINEKRYDSIVLTCINGKVQSAVFDYGTIKSPKKIKSKSYPNAYYIKISGVENSNHIFMMLAANTDVEWSLIQGYNKNTGELENYVGTNNNTNIEITGWYIMTKLFTPQTHLLTRSVHSHPNNNIPSGFDEDRKPGEKPVGDIVTARLIQELYPDFSNFELFRVNSLMFENYNKDSQKADFQRNPPIFYDLLKNYECIK